MCNKFDGHPKGFAYIEFAERDSVQTAMAMDESMFRGRQIKVMPKRTNRPGLSVTNRCLIYITIHIYIYIFYLYIHLIEMK